MSGDRHLRQDPDGRLLGSPPSLATVLVTTEPEYARSVAGQHLLQTLINLLARQFGVVRTVLLDVGDCPVHPGVFLTPPINSGTLVAALITLGEAVGNGLITTRGADGTPATSVVCVGSGLDPTQFEIPGAAVAGHSWRALARTIGPIGALRSGSTVPLGPQLAACIGAGFVFKAAYGKHRPIDATFNLWSMTGEDGPELAGIEFPAGYVLGVGAVGAAFGHALASAQGLQGELVAVDPQEMSDTDRNRLLSGNWRDVGRPKTSLFDAMFRSSGIVVHTFQGRWPQDYLGDPERRVGEELRREEQLGRFRWVISCVDRDRDRAAIASMLPRHVFAGSSLGMAAQTAYYSLAGRCECLACRHRTPSQLGVEELAKQLQGLGTQARKAWYDDHGASPQISASIEEYLSDPTCAGPGAADLAKLGLQGRVDWAVGFVSVAAGVILAARFIRAAVVGVNVEVAVGSECRYLFWVDELRVSRAQRATDCALCRAPGATWHELWGEAEPLVGDK
jgi:hypothetical protein